MVVGRSLSLQGSLTGVIESFRAIGFVKLEDSHSPFITYFKILMRGEDFLNTVQYIYSVRGCFFLEEFRIPVGIKFMDTTEMGRICNITSLSSITLV